MATEAYRYRFRDHVDPLDAEASLHLAIIAAEGLHGEARVRLDASYVIDERIRVIIVNASAPVGRDVCAIFTRFLIAQHGHGAFDVRNVEGQADCASREGGR